MTLHLDLQVPRMMAQMQVMLGLRAATARGSHMKSIGPTPPEANTGTRNDNLVNVEVSKKSAALR